MRCKESEDRADHVRNGEALGQVQPRRPPHLEVVDVLSRGIDAQLQRRALERGRGLHHRNRVGEVGDVFSLRSAIRRRDHPQRPGQVEPLLSGKLRGGRQAHRTVEVAVQLRLTPGCVVLYDSE